MDDGPDPDPDVNDDEFEFDDSSLPADPGGGDLDFGLGSDATPDGTQAQDSDPWDDDIGDETPDGTDDEAPQPDLELSHDHNPWDDEPHEPQQVTATTTPPAEPVGTDADTDPWGGDVKETNGQAPEPASDPNSQPEPEPLPQPEPSQPDDADTVIVAVQVDPPAVAQALLGNHDGDVEWLLGWLDDHRDIRKVVWIDRDRDRRNQASKVLEALDFEVLVLAKPDADVVEGWLSLEDEFA